MAHLRQEHLYVVLLDVKNQVLAVRQVYVGTVNTAKVRACEVFRPAVRENATAVVVVHNHPSGDPTPSRSDMELTEQLIEAGGILNVELLDHVIIGGHTHVSLKDQGWPSTSAALSTDEAQRYLDLTAVRREWP